MNTDGLWDGFVPGRLVHRTQLSEVLITDVRPDGTLRFTCGAQWPRRHPYFGPVDDTPVRVDVAIAAETLRQAMIAVFHRWLGVPFGDAFVMEGLRIRVFEAMRSAAEPGNVRVTVELSDHVERRGMTTEAKSTVRMFLGSQLVAYGRGDARILPPAVVRRLRAGTVMSSARSSRAASWEPTAGGVPEYAVVERDGASLTLHAGSGNPVFFDHPLDQVPGMVIIEGCRQAARIWLHDPTIDIEAITLEFTHHLELHDETHVRTRSTGSTTLTAEFLQRDVTCARASFRITDRFSRRRLADAGDEPVSRIPAADLAVS